jgi:hypothetical protein
VEKSGEAEFVAQLQVRISSGSGSDLASTHSEAMALNICCQFNVSKCTETKAETHNEGIIR